MLLLSLLVILDLFRLLRGDFAHSVAKMEQLIHTHGNVLKNLESYLKREKARLDFLKKQTEIYQREQIRAAALPDYFANPINAFTFISRLTVGLNLLENKIKNVTEYKRNNKLKYPQMKDLNDAALGLERIRDAYALNVTQLANGIIDGIQYSNPMSTSDCYEIARVLMSEEKYDKGIIWLKLALKKYSRNETDTLTFRAEDIVEHIAFSYHKLANLRKAFKWVKRLLEMRPGDPKYIGHVKSLELYERHIIKEDLSKTKSNWNFKYNHEKKPTADNRTDEMKAYMHYDYRLYEALCRDMATIPRDVQKRLKCKYLKKNNPFLWLAPIKMEELYINPRVIMFHDVISDSEIRHVKALARPHLTQGRIDRPRTKSTWRLSDYRSSEVAWMYDNASSTVARITRRISDFTGLNAQRAEPLQVCNYGLGGHYVPHFDATIPNNTNYKNRAENRMATVLFYLSDVPLGGATVFTRLGVAMRPKRGSALYWHNLLPSGELSITSLHAACPVLLGNKWVANKWIYDVGQELQKPCNLKDYKWVDPKSFSLPPPPLKIIP